MSLPIASPISGTVIPLSAVDDPVFAGEIVGPGSAVRPVSDALQSVRAPIAGRVMKMHPHAFVIVPASGPAVLVHLGIDTVSLHGRGFVLHAGEGDVVATGDLLVEWEPAVTREAGLDPVVPVVVLDVDSQRVTSLVADEAPVLSGAPLLRID